MYRILNENSSFRELDIPLQPAQRRELEKRIGKCAPIDPIPVWKGWILIGYEKYELCLKHHRTYLCSEMYFRRQFEAVSWICREQLKRTDLCHPAKAWLVSRLYESLKEDENRRVAKDQFQYKMLSPSFRSEDYYAQLPESTTAMRQLGQEYGYSWRTIQRHVRFGKQLDLLENWFPGIRVRILKGEVVVTIKHFHLLMLMPRDELKKMVLDPACKKLEPPSKMLTDALQDRKSRAKENLHVETAIKNIPAYDPDAELNGLTFTIGAWVKAINRTCEKADFSHSTLNGKNRLRDTLTALKMGTVSLEKLLEVTNK